MSSQIPTIDFAPFTSPSFHSPASRLLASTALVTALHRYGFTKITNHGLSPSEVSSAFTWNQRLFSLPHASKMQAPHPPGPFPHRGYSGRIPDGELKESYETGSEEDDQQENIWLPEETLPGFRAYANGLYERMAGVAEVVLTAIAVGLGLDEGEKKALMELASRRHSQLRFMHYPAVEGGRVQSEEGEEERRRLAAHNDWGYVLQYLLVRDVILHMADFVIVRLRCCSKTKRAGWSYLIRRRGSFYTPSQKRARWWSTLATCSGGLPTITSSRLCIG